MSDKKPDHVKKLQGTFREDRAQDTVKKDTEIPPPRKFLSRKPMKDIYYFIMEHLMENASLLAADSFLVSQMALNVYLMEKASRDVIKYGTTQEVGKNKYVQVTPYYTTLERERKQFTEYCKIFGIGIAIREKIHAFAESASTTVGESVHDPITKLRRIS